MKYFRFSWNEVLWEMSWSNVLMLSATIPSFDDDEKGKGKGKGKGDTRAKKIDEEDIESFFNFKQG